MRAMGGRYPLPTSRTHVPQPILSRVILLEGSPRFDQVRRRDPPRDRQNCRASRRKGPRHADVLGPFHALFAGQEMTQMAWRQGFP